jgi:hypothetical protein
MHPTPGRTLPWQGRESRREPARSSSFEGKVALGPEGASFADEQIDDACIALEEAKQVRRIVRAERSRWSKSEKSAHSSFERSGESA